MRRITLASLALLAGLALAGDKPAFEKVKEITLQGGAYFDYLTVQADRLYVAHGNAIDVVNLAKGEKVGEVPGVDRAHGAVILKDRKRGFASSGTKDKLIVFDLKTLKVTKEIATGKKPDACLYVAATNEVWTMNGKDGTISCVDPSALSVVHTIEVGGALEACVESSKGLVYVNVEDQSLVVQIDAKKHAVLNKWKLEGEGGTGLALDEKNGVLFSGCEKALVFTDAATGKNLGKQEIAAGCDGVAFDPETGCAFASCGKGPTTVVREKDGKTFELVTNLETAPVARTCTLDKSTHRVYIASSSKGEKSVKVLVFAPTGGRGAEPRDHEGGK